MQRQDEGRARYHRDLPREEGEGRRNQGRENSQERIRIPDVEYSTMVNDTTGYILLSGFTDGAATNVRNEIVRLQKDGNLKNLFSICAETGAVFSTKQSTWWDVSFRKAHWWFLPAGSRRKRLNTGLHRNRSLRIFRLSFWWIPARHRHRKSFPAAFRIWTGL